MPFYEYECASCKFYTEVMQKISDAPLEKCPSCGKKALKKLVSAPVFRLKGAGWYETDFKSDNEGKRNIADREEPAAKSEESKAADTKAGDAKTADTKTGETKPAAADSGGKGTAESGASGRAAKSPDAHGAGHRSGAAGKSTAARTGAARSKPAA